MDMNIHNVTSIKSELNSTFRIDGTKFYWKTITFCDKKGNIFKINAISDNVESLNIIKYQIISKNKNKMWG